MKVRAVASLGQLADGAMKLASGLWKLAALAFV
jgi:X-X-X-Leu-X-X-Gly heptad repeat protein